MARGVRLPKRPPARDRFLTAPQVRASPKKLGKEGDLVLAMTYLGLRWSELAALRVADVNLVRRRVHIAERVTAPGPGRPGGSQELRVQPARRNPRPAPADADRTCRGQGPRRAGVHRTAPHGDLRNRNWRQRSGFDPAVKELGLNVTPHDLRRTFGTLARAVGAVLRWIQKAMGHESITTTAGIYAHHYDDELDSVAAALDRIGRGG